MTKKINKLGFLILLLLLNACAFQACTPANSPTPQNTPDTSPLSSAKISSRLAMQLDLRKAQLAGPTPERLSQMQSQGMNITDLSVQRIYIYLNEQPTSAQTAELQSLGINIYLNSWIPPVGNNPAGFVLADLPIAKLLDLISKDYVIRLDSAETRSDFQSQPDGIQRSN